MSSLAYGALTKTREEAQPGTSSSTASPGVRSWVDALAALVPAEVLAVHALIISYTTQTTTSADGQVTTIITDPGTLSVMFWVLLVLSSLLYFVAHTRKEWDQWDYLRVLIPPLAFVGWTMLQKTTAFDAVWPTLGDPARNSGALVLAVVLGLVASKLAQPADQKPPSSG